MGNLVGRSLAHFRIDAQLGEGGMGVVYRATDEKLQRQVALKVLPDSFALDEDRRLRFLREARAAAAVTHANIATVHDVGEAEGHVYIAMELVEGETLGARIAKGLSVPEGVRIAREIARGLDRAHEKGIVHRDLKPENVMITRREEVKILDFGLAKLREESAVDRSALEKAETAANLTREGRVVGTPAYMSPEQGRGERVDARSDVFAFGVVLFEMLTGERPFAGDTAMAVIIAASRDTPKRASEINPLVSPELDRVIERCLEKLPSARYGSGAQLLGALDALSSEPGVPQPVRLHGGPIGAAVSLAATEGSMVAPKSPRRWRWGVVGLGAIAAVGIGVGYRAETRRAHPGAPPITSGSASAPAPSVTTLLTLPPPATKIPEAAAEYAAGMQSLHDNSWGDSSHHFARSVELDPTLASGYLRVTMSLWGAGLTDRERMRASFVRAATQRGVLSPHDQTLLEALEPVLQRVDIDRAEAIARLEGAERKNPYDVEILDWLGMLQEARPADALVVAERAVGLDPADGQAWQTLGSSQQLLGRDQEARAAFDHCAHLAVESTDCLEALVDLDSQTGKCEAFEADARRLRDREATMGVHLAVAMSARGLPTAAMKEVLDSAYAATLDRDWRAMGGAFEGLFFARLAGDLGRAGQIATQTLAMMSSTSRKTAIDLRADFTEEAIELLEETGNLDEVRKLAGDFGSRSEGWGAIGGSNSTGLLDVPLLILRQAGPGAVSSEEFERRRASWIDAHRRTSARYPWFIWASAYAATARTAGEAQEALVAMPTFGPPSSAGDLTDAYTGHVYVLADRAAEAVPYLQRAASHCDALQSVTLTRASLWLGEALEATGDKPGACAAYKVVLDRWGHAKPRSVTADKARERAKALACRQ